MSAVATDAAPPRRFRLEIEGLRAVAALLVAAYHVWFGRVSGGVDVFFVIAGFMVTTTLLGHIERTGRIDAGRFLGRLLTRLLPNALVVLTAVAIATWWLIPSTRHDEVYAEITASALYYENWELAARSVDYLERGFTSSPVQHFWAMSIQGQFYLIWLVLFVLLATVARSRPRRVIAATMVVAVLGSFAFSLWLTAVEQPVAYFHTGTRVWEFGTGGLLAMTVAWWPALGRRTSFVLGWVGLLAIVSCGAVLSVGTSFPGWIALWPVAGAALILLAGHHESRLSACGLLSSKPLVKLGSVSYALYLWHWPLLVFVLVLTERDQVGPLVGLAIIAVSIALAFASTHLVERPVRSVRLDRRRAWVAPLVAALVVAPMAGASYAVSALSGAPTIAVATDVDPDSSTAPTDSGSEPLTVATGLDPEVYPGALALDPENSMTARSENTDEPAPGIAAAPEDLTGAYEEGCHEGVRGEEVVVCEYGDPEADRTMILTGGSHSAHWQPALELVADQQGWRLLMTTKSACKPGTHLASTGSNIDTAVSCREWNAKATEWIQEQNPDLVVLTSTTVTREKAGEYIPDGYPLLWEELADEDTDVLAIRDNPRASEDVPDCLATKDPLTTECDVPRSRYVEKDLTASYQDLDNVHFVDLSDYMCEGESCPAVIGNVVVYSDETHLTRSYVRSLAQPLLRSAPVLQ